MSIGKLKTSKVVVWAAAATITFLIISGIFWPYIKAFWQSTFGPGPEENPPTKFIYAGNLRINQPMYWSYDNSKPGTNQPTVTYYHADKRTLFGSAPLDTPVTGELWQSDNGILYAALDWGTGTSYYCVANEIVTGTGYVVESFAWDHDNDGTLEYGFKLDFTSLTPLAAGETQKEVTINYYVWKAELSPTLTKVSDATGVSTSAYNYYTAEGYVSGWDGEGYAFKIVKVELTLPDAGNATYADDGTVKLQRISLVYRSGATYSWSSYSWELANKRYLMNIGVTDTTQEYYGLPVFYERGAGSTFAKWTVQIYAKFPATGRKWCPTLKITYIKPDGTTGTTSVAMTFSS